MKKVTPSQFRKAAVSDRKKWRWDRPNFNILTLTISPDGRSDCEAIRFLPRGTVTDEYNNDVR